MLPPTVVVHLVALRVVSPLSVISLVLVLSGVSEAVRLKLVVSLIFFERLAEPEM